MCGPTPWSHARCLAPPQVLFESIPQSFFQLSLRSSDPLIVGSVFIGWLSLACHAWQLRTEAR